MLAFVRLFVFLLLGLLSCRSSPVEDARGLLALVETEHALELRRSLPEPGGWENVRTLPTRARSVVVSPDGRSLAWVEDEPPRMVGWAWPRDAKEPVRLGELGLSRVDASGLAVNDAGEVAWVDENRALRVHPDERRLDEGHSPVWMGRELVWVEFESGCARSEGGRFKEVCGPALRTLAADARSVAFATPSELVLWQAGILRREPLSEPVFFAFGHGEQDAVVHRARVAGRPVDAVLIRSKKKTAKVVYDIVASLAASDSSDMLAVVRSSRRDVYELLLAHAPQEFGGARTLGTAIRLSVDGRVRPIAGLPEGQVRWVGRAKTDG